MKLPTSDFVASSLNGAITNVATEMTIGTGLEIPATNGILQIDNDSTTAVGLDNGPETIYYTAYNTATGAVTGITRGVVNTDAGGNGVAHANGASVVCAPSAYIWQLLGTDLILPTAWTPTLTGCASTTTADGRYWQIGKTMFVYFNVLGVSNATTFTITGFPAAPANMSALGVAPYTVDNSSVTTTPGKITIASGSTTGTMRSDTATGAWTNSNNKGMNMLLTYEVA